MTQTPLIPATARIGRTALVVGNLDEMIEFYREVVGLTVHERDGPTATLGVDRTPLLVLQRDEDAPPRSSEQAGLFHNAFAVPSRAALGAALERIRDRWELDGASDHYVSEALYLTDPEGNGVEIYTDRLEEEWPRADDGRVQIGTVPLDLENVAAASNGAEAAPAGTTVGHVHLEVSSLDVAREFYVETLGLREQTAAQSALFVAAGDYHHHLGLNTWGDRSQPAGARGLAWFELVVPDEDSLGTVRRRLADTDVSVDDVEGNVEITDPDGITIRVRAE